MKTLYININNELIQSNEEIEVLNYDLDSDFFFYLGEKIAKGCKVENENALITDFNTQDNEEDYKQIIAQWNEMKSVLFSERCVGEFDFTLPYGYIHWLKFHPQYVSIYDKNFSHGESATIVIDLEELYEESVEDLQRKISRTLRRNNLYLDIDEITFNIYAVTRHSPLVRSIKKQHYSIGFIPYQKFLRKFEIEKKQHISTIEEYNRREEIQYTNSINDNNKPTILECRKFKIKGIEFKMRYVKAGTFVNQEGTNIRLTNDFYIGETPVTQELWYAVMGSRPSYHNKDENWRILPVEQVSYPDCVYFIHKLNEISGLGFKLPTVAEWEFAARGGTQSNDYIYSGGNNPHDVAWYADNSGFKTHPVALKKPNELGIYDMTGNVAEWCSDKLGPLTEEEELRYYNQFKEDTLVNPERCYYNDSISKSNCFHVLGGSYGRGKYDITLNSCFNYIDRNSAFSNVGFRLVLEYPNEEYLSCVNGINLGVSTIKDFNNNNVVKISNSFYRSDNTFFVTNEQTNIITLIAWNFFYIPANWKEHLMISEIRTIGDIRELHTSILPRRGWVKNNDDIWTTPYNKLCFAIMDIYNEAHCCIFSAKCSICGSEEFEYIADENGLHNAICKKCNNKHWDF